MPATQIEPTLIASCSIDPRHSGQFSYAAWIPILAAAGIVVTEISTPARAPDFEVVSDSTPATPAQNATKNEKKSGFANTDAKL